jgi:hypothetical protein
MGLMSDPGLDALAPPDGPVAFAALVKINRSMIVQYGEPVAGKKCITRVLFWGSVNDAHLILLRNLTELRGLHFNSGNGALVTDAGLRGLRRNKKLAVLDLGKTQVTDKGLEELRHLPQLKQLELAGTAVTDKGMPALARCPSLTRLDLTLTKVSGRGLLGLKDTKSIHTVVFRLNGPVPPDVVAELWKLPTRLNVTY